MAAHNLEKKWAVLPPKQNCLFIWFSIDINGVTGMVLDHGASKHIFYNLSLSVQSSTSHLLPHIFHYEYCLLIYIMSYFRACWAPNMKRRQLYLVKKPVFCIASNREPCAKKHYTQLKMKFKVLLHAVCHVILPAPSQRFWICSDLLNISFSNLRPSKSVTVVDT